MTRFMCDILPRPEDSFYLARPATSNTMSPVMNPQNVPEPPPPPPLPQSSMTSLPISTTHTSSSTPPTPTVGSPNKNLLKAPELGAGMRRQSSFSSLLQKFATDQHFAIEWLERDDDECSIVSVDSVASVGSSMSGNLSRQGSFVDVREATAGGANSYAAASKPGLTASSVAKLDKNMDGMKIDPNRKRLSQAMIWTWLTSTKQNPLHEDAETTVPSALSTAGLERSTAPATAPTAELPKAKINTEKLRAKLIKTYPKYYRDLNAMSPNNW